jgi:hypothetical protein
MNGLKYFVVSICKALLLVFTVAGTAIGALWGASLTQPLSPSIPLLTYLGPETFKLIGIGVGAVLGFLGPALTVSLLFLLTEIQKNTRETAASLKFITNGAAPAAEPYT